METDAKCVILAVFKVPPRCTLASSVPTHHAITNNVFFLVLVILIKVNHVCPRQI